MWNNFTKKTKKAADHVSINVGGRIFETTKSTLIRSPYFTDLFDNPNPAELVNGCYFIDRSNILFELILDFLRSNRFSTHLGLVDMAALLEEFHYYRIDIFGSNSQTLVRIKFRIILHNSNLF